MHGGPTESFTRTTPGSGRGPQDAERFLPGALVAGRYRIRGRIGVGGMGEVYHADDLRLGQPVALKFLTAAFAADPARLGILDSEVRLARQVSHPNVCRVYDIGEVDGLPFLTMEFIDGENLASLLRRVGRLPAPKLVELAHQLCAGLAAAHECGILHRDLKPANVMVDGRGIARITDFGIALPETELGDVSEIAGTPAYMAPEQSRGERLTPASDLYALGLILYEAATGQPYSEGGAGARKAEGGDGTVAIAGIDPGLEHGISWCLAPDPARRPPSPLAVASLLPGGNLLAATLRAGGTPSPELVAASGESGRLTRGVAGGLLALALAGFAAVVSLAGSAVIVNRVPLPKPPVVLVDRAREDLGRLAPRASLRHEAHGFAYHVSSLEQFAANRAGSGYWRGLLNQRPSPIVFWYRTSPRQILPPDIVGSIQQEFPPLDVPGMSLVVLDPEGRLLRLRTVPGASSGLDSSAAAPWVGLLAAAGFTADSLREVSPVGIPAAYAMERRAWLGRWPESAGQGVAAGGRSDTAGQPVRVEGSALAGQPVDFVVGTPDSAAGPYTGPLAEGAAHTGALLQLALYIAGIVVAGWLAWRNFRMGRVDRRGAFRLAGLLSSISFLRWVVGGPHAMSLDIEWNALQVSLGEALRLGALVWVFYAALEPHVRRRMPQCLITWNRLLYNRFLDSLVGRDLLVGALAGEAFVLLYYVDKVLPEWLGLPPVTHPITPPLMTLSGLGPMAIASLSSLIKGITGSMALLATLLVLLLTLRRWAWAAAAFVVLYSITYALEGGSPLSLSLGLSVAGVILLVGVLRRFGLVATTIATAMSFAGHNVPIVSDLSSWGAWSTGVAAMIMLAPAVYGAWLCVRRAPGRAGVFGGAVVR